MIKRTRLALAALAATCSAAAAQETQPAEPPPESSTSEAVRKAEEEPGKIHSALLGPPKWTVQVEPMAWWVSPSGKVRLPATSGTGGSSGGGFADSGEKVRVDSLNLDTPRLRPMGQVHLNAEKWRFSFTGGDSSLSRDRTTAEESFRLGSVEFAAGDAMNVDYHLTAIETTVGYQVWSRDFAVCSSDQKMCVQSDLRLYVFGGVRLTDFSLQVSRLSGAAASADADELYVEPIVGVRFELELVEDFFLDAEVSGGYYADSDRSASSIDVTVGFAWRPHPNVGMQIGWRQLATSLSDGDDGPATSSFEFDGRLAGLFAGVLIRF